ncbi:hypothetical protein MPTK1_6g19530 [Marchantia polymorpha subsp. ruderalis]|uniref:C-terminal of Roc (COR) domain-containing protein n=2 Tax=Marchantia polymorpha TaxID=3197 RepID=A0A176VTC3_MARPO|nr:hypothetical protein AXG93_2402s1370 [Marchantia polymorpha subsp. ruderalis]PTQ39458.1 hypothetical protein MARPO_0045s0110 [Marchantia polymorpha]BBN15430.1 hypothetical protein Mp_6g19530 [Marchantia polymorpha subsp. ruderalis]|eukprot:PTQ39458.1 hypothetical protein MARPO_0045s0110 [Marchantia polymorpha]
MVPDTSNVDYDYWELIPDEGSMPVRAESVGKRLLAALRNLLEQQNGGTLAEQSQRNLRNFHVLQELETYDDFFDGGILCPPEASPRTQLRFRLLKKHGNCRTRRAIIVRPEKNDPDSDLSASEWETLLNPLLYNSRLEELYVNSCDSVDMAVQNKVYSIVGEVLRTSSSLQYLFLEMKGVSAANVARLARGLEQNRGSNLEALVFLDRPEASAMKHVWEMIERAPRLRHLWLKKPGALDDVGVEAWAEAVRRSTSLVKLTVEDTALDGRVSKLLSESFTGDRRNSSVKHLELIKLRGAAAGWKSVFDALRLNTTVNRLEFWGCESLDSEAAFGNLVALLNVNSTLQMIKNRGAPSSEKDMKDLLIEKLLDRNDYRRSYFSVLRDAKLPFVSAKSGTLLLCGSPLSGKTRLRTTMQKVLKNQSCTEAFTETVRSTRGIEVEMMRNDDKMQISLWDLSGQEIYRDVQHRLVPRGNQAHVYVFVFSPFELQGAGNNVHQRKQNLESAFWTELLYLLRSVASLTTTTLYIPMVVVVITHADLLTDEEKDVAWATKIVGEFRSVFDGVVGICTDVHQINAKDEADVGQMMQRVLYLFETLLQTATHIIPSACAELSSIIQQQHWNLPVWNRLQFYEFCHQNSHAEALGSFRLAFSAGSKEWKAVLEYLHDVRVIFLVPNSDLVIVDLNWLASSFLGELISMIDNHPAKDSTICFIDAKSLQSILGTLVTERLETYHFDHIFLKELLVKLIFCYRRAGEEGFLAPTLIRRKKSQAE